MRGYNGEREDMRRAGGRTVRDKLLIFAPSPRTRQCHQIKALFVGARQHDAERDYVLHNHFTTEQNPRNNGRLLRPAAAHDRTREYPRDLPNFTTELGGATHMLPRRRNLRDSTRVYEKAPFPACHPRSKNCIE